MALREDRIQVNSFNWFYREAAPPGSPSKAPVVLLHGLVAQSYSYRDVMTQLAEQGLRTISPDWLGHGFSDRPEKRQFDYTPTAFVAGLAGWLQALELKRFSLVVQGFMGSAGLLYALQHPDQIERLVILNTPLSPGVKLPWKMRQLGLPLIGDMSTQDPLLVDRILEGGSPYQVEDADLDVYRRPFLTTSAAGRSLMYTVRSLNLAEVSAEIQTRFQTWERPTLVAWGLSDPWLPAESAKAFAAGLKHGEFTGLEQVGHYPQEDWADKVSQSVGTFLRQQIP
ncbi:MAG: alpha/beta fold hydrolase [Cyanobacteria bacterium P01_H01_bin.119]